MPWANFFSGVYLLLGDFLGKILFTLGEFFSKSIYYWAKFFRDLGKFFFKLSGHTADLWPLRGTQKLSLPLQDCVPSTDDVFSDLQNATETSGGEFKTKGREVPPNLWEEFFC